MEELRPGLWWWTAPHPDWTPADGGPDGWEQEVSSYAYETEATIVLLDPQTPPPQLVERAAGKDVAVVLTCAWHERSSKELADRLGAGIWQPGDDGEPAAGVVAFEGSPEDEAVLWIPEHRAVVIGDTMVTRERLEVPATWLPEGVTVAWVADRLAPVLELPVELVLTTHGEPTRANGLGELRRALLQSGT